MSRSSNDDRSDTMNRNNDAYWADQANRNGDDGAWEDGDDPAMAGEGGDPGPAAAVCYRCLTCVEGATPEELVAAGWMHKWPAEGACGWNCRSCKMPEIPSIKSTVPPRPEELSFMEALFIEAARRHWRSQRRPRP